MTEPVAVGFRCHSGWAVMVSASRSGQSVRILDRQRVEFLPPDLPRQPFHGVAEEGLARSVIVEVEEAAAKSALRLLESVPAVSAVGLVASERQLPDDLDAILKVHARLHAAEGRLYEQAVIDAAGVAGLAVYTTAPGTISVSSEVEALGRVLGPPWQKDHKWATVAAINALSAEAPERSS